MKKSISILALNVALFLGGAVIYQNATVALVGILANALFGAILLGDKKLA